MKPKTYLTDLAIFGGQPAFQEKLYICRPNVPDSEQLFERLHKMLESKWLSNNGAYVQEFEQRIGELVKVKHCVAICNGTTALEIVARACGLNREVIVPSFTAIATPHALQWLGLSPVFADIDLETHNIDPQHVEKLITPRTSGIVGVHLWGRPCNVAVLTTIAQEHDLHLIFDAAHAFGCSYNGKMIGNFGEAEVYSFHATKFFNTFEGGAVVTNNDELAEKVRLMKNFGYADYGNVLSTGTNGKMDEASAAMGLALLEKLEELITVNFRNYKQYKHLLSSLPGIKLNTYDEKEKGNYQYIVLEIDEVVCGFDVSDLARVLHAENVFVRRYFYPACHLTLPYQSQVTPKNWQLPATECVSERVLCLPTGTSIGQDEIAALCQIIRFVVEKSWEVHRRLY